MWFYTSFIVAVYRFFPWLENLCYFPIVFSFIAPYFVIQFLNFGELHVWLYSLWVLHYKWSNLPKLSKDFPFFFSSGLTATSDFNWFNSCRISVIFFDRFWTSQVSNKFVHVFLLKSSPFLLTVISRFWIRYFHFLLVQRRKPADLQPNLETRAELKSFPTLRLVDSIKSIYPSNNDFSKMNITRLGLIIWSMKYYTLSDFSPTLTPDVSTRK